MKLKSFIPYLLMIIYLSEKEIYVIKYQLLIPTIIALKIQNKGFEIPENRIYKGLFVWIVILP